MSQKYLDLAGLTAYDGKIKQWFKSGLVDITEDAIRALFPVVQPDNEIWYTTSDITSVYFNNSRCNTTLVSDTYKDGKGIAKFKDNILYTEGSFTLNDDASSQSTSFMGMDISEDRPYLTSLSLPNNLEEIKSFSFYGRVGYDTAGSIGGVEELRLGKNIKKIHACSGLSGENVYFGGNLSNWCNIDFTEEITPGTFINNFEDDWNPSIILGIVRDKLFIENKELIDVVIPEDITEIKQYSFKSLKYLKTLDLNNVVGINKNAFEGCVGLTSIDLKNVQTIGDNAFSGCVGLTSIDLKNVQTIGDNAFSGCTNITSIIIPSTVTNIGSNAFKGAYIQLSNFVNNSSLDAEANNYWGAVVYEYITEDGLMIKGTEIIRYNGGSGIEDNPKYIEIPKTTTSIASRAIVGAKNIYITYDGTEEEWNAIEKGGYEFEPSYWCWNSSSPGRDYELIIKLKDKDIELWSAGI